MMARSAPAVIITIIILSLTSATTVNALSFHNLVHKAIQFYDKGDYKKALFYDKQALKINKKDPLLLANLGGIYANIEDYNSSIIFYKKALVIEPNYISALVGMGSVLAHLYSPENMTFFKKAVAIPISHPTSVEHNEKATAYGHLKDYQKAISIVDNILKSKTVKPEQKFYALGIKGTTILDLGENNKTAARAAASIFNSLLKTHPIVLIMDDLGIALNYLGNYTGAITVFDKAKKLDPKDDYAAAERE